MKPNVPSTNTVYSRRLTSFPEIALQLKLLFICATSVFAFGLNSTARALEPGKIWVASWTTSPQGPCPAGWAVVQPVLSFALPRGDTDGATDQTFRLIVKPDLWSKTIRLRLANTFGNRPVTLGAVTVGLQSTGGNLLAGKVQQVLFHGKPEVAIPVGEELYRPKISAFPVRSVNFRLDQEKCAQQL